MSSDPRFFAFLKQRIGLDVASVGEVSSWLEGPAQAAP